MDWDDLKFFLAVARSGSLAAGARLLKVKHSTVLRRISNLENRLGARLFDRTPTGYLLTQAGSDIVDTAQDVEAAAFEIERRTLGRDRALTGELRVSMTDVVGRQVAGALTSFRRLHPGIVVDVLITAEPLSLAKRQADVAIRVGSRPEPYLIGKRLMDVHFAVYGSQDYLGARPVSKALLPGWAAYDWVVLDQDGDAFPQASWERKHIAEELVALRTNSSPLVFDAVRAGIGVAILATASADTDPAFVRVSDEIFDFGLSTWVLTHSDLRRIPRVRAFMDFIVSEARRPAIGFPFR